MGFAEPETVAAILEKWRSGRYRVTQGGRSRELLAQLTPGLLTAMLGTANPDLAVARFDQLLGGLPTGLQIFALFHANVHVMETVAEILVSAPAFADLLTQRPSLFETLIEFEQEQAAPSRAALDEDLSTAVGTTDDLEEAVFRTGRWVDGMRFRTGVQMLYRRIDPLDAATVLSDIADASLSALLPRAEDAVARRHGRIQGSEAAILALGRLGSREMSLTSDLDLVLVYDAPEGASSDGPRPLAAPAYFNRLLRRLLSGLGAQPGQRCIYEIDMRLRPSGNSGPLATSLESYEKYQKQSAWTWERMALTRARVIAGPAKIAAKLEEIIRETLSRGQDPEELRRDVADMRLRMDKEFHTDDVWSIKHHRGGLVDIEFMAQYLVLREFPRAPGVVLGDARRAFDSIARLGALPAAKAERLIDAWRLWTRIQGCQRLIRDDAAAEDIPTGLRPLFAEMAGVESFAEVEPRMVEAAQFVRRAYADLLGPIDGD